MPSYASQTDPGSFVPTTTSFDVRRVYDMDPNSQEFKDFLVGLMQQLNTMAIVLNTKDSGYYVEQEFVNGQIYFPDPTLGSSSTQTPVLRQVFRLVVDFGALPNTGTTSVAHGLTITSGFSFTRIYGVATDPSTAFIPIPFASSTGSENIKLDVDATNVNITTGSDRTAFTTCYVVLEYIKQ